MLSLYLLITPSLLALRAASLSILLPLYIYPGDNYAAWQPAIDSFNANPNVHYDVIVNPASGPGNSDYPDPSYIAGLKALNKIKNVRTIGYVDTAYAKRDIKLVNKDIDTYANWASFNEGNITVHGIFFDDVSTTDSISTYTYYKNLGEYTSTHDNHIPYVVFNPGTIAPAQLFGYCDTMIEFEGSYSTYTTSFKANALPGSSPLRHKSAIIVTQPPANADVAGLVHTMANEGIGSVYFSSDCCYQSLNAALLQQLAAAVAKG